MKKLTPILLMLFASSIYSANLEISNVEHIPDYIIKEIINIARASDENNIQISSKTRTVKKQVEVMLDYYILCDKVADSKKQCGIELAKKVYDKACHGGFSAFDPLASRQVNISRMTKALTKSLILLGEKRTCMNHVIIPGIVTKNIAIDIKPSSISDKKRFYRAVINNKAIVRFYYPAIPGVPKSSVKDAAFHLEFKRENFHNTSR